MPLILKSGLFPEAANVAMFKNHNESIDNSSFDYSNLSLKEEETWAGFGQGNLINESSLGKARSWVQMLQHLMSMHQHLTSNNENNSYAGTLLGFKQS